MVNVNRKMEKKNAKKKKTDPNERFSREEEKFASSNQIADDPKDILEIACYQPFRLSACIVITRSVSFSIFFSNSAFDGLLSS